MLRREVTDHIHDQIRRAGRVAFERAVRSQARCEVAVEGDARPVIRRRDERLIGVARPERQVAIRRRVQGRRVADYRLRSCRNVCASSDRRLRIWRASNHRHSRRVAAGLACARVE